MLRVPVVAVVVGLVAPARADTPAPVGPAQTPVVPTEAPASPSQAPATPTIDYFHKGDSGKVKIRRERSRTRDQRRLIYGLAGGAAAFGLFGAYFHYDSKQIADELSADVDQHQRWSPELQDKYDRGQLDGKLAIAGYAVSAGLIAATIVVVVKTDPGTELVGPGGATPVANVVPGGATVGASWSW